MRTALMAIAVAAATLAPAQTPESPDPYANETKEQRDARMAWWREARFGMFIHWGVYAVPAGTHRGSRVDGTGEWIMYNGRIPVADYKDYAKQFDPVKYDPDAWVGLAKRAGMKYLVITAKHHDGFALFKSGVTRWDVAGATPYKRDLLLPLVEAAHREGLRVGFYYSQAQDWVHPGGAKSGYEDGGGWDDAQKGSFDDYLRTIAVPQVQELLERYPIDVLWWDTPHMMTKERAELFLPLLPLRPGLIHNDQLGGGYKGDLDIAVQVIPPAGTPGRDWEACMTINDTWGFKRDDNNWKSDATLIRNLVEIASKGGNCMLNVGPTAEGEIPAPAVERLEAVGKWMEVNGESIYGTAASPFLQLPWGRCTKKVRPDGATLYLHVFRWPTDGSLRVPGLISEPREIRVLATGARLQDWRWRDNSLEIALPLAAPDPVCSVLRVEIAGALKAEAITLKQGRDGGINLPAEMAELNSPAYGGQLVLEQRAEAGRYNIGYWSDPRAWVRWTFLVEKPGAYDVVVSLANPADNSRFQLQVARQRIAATVGTTGSWTSFKKMPIGRIRFDQAGQFELSVRPDPKAWNPINLCEVTLSPVR